MENPSTVVGRDRPKAFGAQHGSVTKTAQPAEPGHCAARVRDDAVVRPA
jgi:hypothetical protein